MAGAENTVPAADRTKAPEESWLQRKLNWQALRGLGESRTAQVSTLAPFFGFAILYHADAQTYLGGLGGALSRGAEDASACPGVFSLQVRLHLFFLGATLLGVGALTYRLFAPGIVRSYKLPADYVDRESPYLTARNLRSMCVTILARNPRVGRMLRRDSPWLDRAEVGLADAQRDAVKPVNSHVGTDVLRSYYNTLDRWTLRWAVYLTFVLFALGVLLAAAPGLAFSWRVLCVIVSGLAG